MEILWIVAVVLLAMIFGGLVGYAIGRGHGFTHGLRIGRNRVGGRPRWEYSYAPPEPLSEEQKEEMWEKIERRIKEME